MTVLLKDTNFSYVPGSPGTLSDPGTAPRPAYCTTTSQSETTYYYFYIAATGTPFTTGYVAGYYLRIPETKVTTQTICYPAFPGSPPIVGIAPTAEQTTADFNLGWNSGAVSRAVLASDCVYTFALPSSVVGVVTGLNNSNGGASYEEIDYGFYLSHGRAVIYELGVSKSSAFSYTSATVFKVALAGKQITYLMDGVVVYTSAVPTTGAPLFVDASLYSGGDSISSASFLPVTSPGNVAASFLPLAGTASNYAYSSSQASFNPLTGTAGQFPYSSSAGLFLPLTGLSANKAYAGSAAALNPLTTTINSGGLVPTYSLSAGSFATLITSARTLTGGLGQSASSFAPIAGLSADRSYGESRGSFLPLSGFTAERVVLNGVVTASLTKPFGLVAYATETAPNSTSFELSMPTVAAYGGATSRTSLAAPTLLATGVGVVVGRVIAAMPLPTLVASGTTNGSGTVRATLSTPFASQIFSGSVAEITLADGFKLNASGLTFGTGALRATMPLYQLVATGTDQAYGRIAATMPMIRPVSSGVLNASLSGFSLIAIGTAVVIAEYEAYAVNLAVPSDKNSSDVSEPAGSEVTHYTNFPFNQIVRFNNRYYGLGDTGLFLLGGNFDAGQPISWAFRTAKTDFGATQKKTVVSTYLGGSVGSTATAKVIAGENEELSYTYPVPVSASGQNYRVKFGKGLKTRYFAMEMSDTQGSLLEADTVDFEIAKLARAL